MASMNLTAVDICDCEKARGSVGNLLEIPMLLLSTYTTSWASLEHGASTIALPRAMPETSGMSHPCEDEASGALSVSVQIDTPSMCWQLFKVRAGYSSVRAR